MSSTRSARTRPRKRGPILEGVVLYTRDLGRAKRFYRDAVGLPLILEEEHVAHFDAGTVRLALHIGEPPAGEAGFLVLGVGDLDAAVSELGSRGVAFEGPTEERPYGRVAYFRDPDGHRVALWQPPRRGGPLVRRFERILARL